MVTYKVIYRLLVSLPSHNVRSYIACGALRMNGRLNFRRVGTWMGAVALVIQVLIPFIIALDAGTLSASAAGHARDLALVGHVHSGQPQGQHALAGIPGKETQSVAHHGSQNTHFHVSCPLCLALHASVGTFAPMVGLLTGPSSRCEVAWPASTAPTISICPAFYLACGPPGLA